MNAPNVDDEQLRLLSIFHYVVGGMAALFGCIPIFHLAMGILFLTQPGLMKGPPGGNSPPPADFIGWMFVVLGSVFILSGWTLAILLVVAGRCIAQRKRLLFCTIVAGVGCVFMPFGTILGVFSLIVLTRSSVKELFASSSSTR